MAEDAHAGKEGGPGSPGFVQPGTVPQIPAHAPSSHLRPSPPPFFTASHYCPPHIPPQLQERWVVTELHNGGDLHTPLPCPSHFPPHLQVRGVVTELLDGGELHTPAGAAQAVQ